MTTRNYKMASRRSRYCGLMSLLLLFAFYLVPLLTNNWLKTTDINVGLWKECKKGTGCVTMEKSPSYDVPFLDWFSAVRSFMVLPCIFNVGAMILLLCNICFEEYFRIKPIRVALTFCVIFLICAIVIFPVEKGPVYDSSWKLDWSYYLAVISLVFTIILTVVFYRMNDEKVKSLNHSSYELRSNGQNMGEINGSNIPGTYTQHQDAFNNAYLANQTAYANYTLGTDPNGTAQTTFTSIETKNPVQEVKQALLVPESFATSTSAYSESSESESSDSESESGSSDERSDTEFV